MSSYRLAQINFSRLRSPLTDPRMARFVNLLESVNVLAEATPGFVWRMDELSAAPCGDRLFPHEKPGTTLVNLSVWKSVGALQRYTQIGLHAGVMNARQSWFKRYEGRWVALWWVPEGHFPEVRDGWDRLQYLRRFSDTPYAFTFGSPFPPPAHGQDYLPRSENTEPAGKTPEVSFRVAAKRSWLPWFLDW